MSDSQKTEKPLISFRHDPDVKELVLKKAEKSNISPATMARLIFNAGLTAMYKVEIKGNKMISPPR
jgi:hypothetical protein